MTASSRAILQKWYLGAKGIKTGLQQRLYAAVERAGGKVEQHSETGRADRQWRYKQQEMERMSCRKQRGWCRDGLTVLQSQC